MVVCFTKFIILAAYNDNRYLGMGSQLWLAASIGQPDRFSAPFGTVLNRRFEMNTTHTSRSLTTTLAGGVATLTSPDARNLMTLGREYGWNFTVLGQAPLPSDPVRFEDWVIVPAHQDSSPVPERAFERVQTIFAAGLRPKGFVIVHEAPKLLPASLDSKPDTLQMSLISPKLKSTLKLAGGALGTVGVMLVTITGLAVLAMAVLFVAAMLLAPAMLVMGATMVDPILIAVTEDGCWIEIDRWMS
jgi:hypothetical protein